MPIQFECDSCGRRLKVKEERAGRRIRCPDCQEAIEVPAADDDFADAFAEERRPSGKSRRPRSASRERRSGRKAKAEKSGFRRNWHWIAVLVMLLFALWPGSPGLVIVGLFSAVGVVMVLVGGIYPFLRVLFGAPGTVLLMILSRSARFDMMRAPDNHPYKVLMRTAFDPTRGLFWKGVLLMVMFIPGAMINQNLPELFKSRGPEADAQIAGQNPNPIGPGRGPARQARPERNPNAGAGQNHGRPGFAPQGRANPRPAGEDGPRSGFPPRRAGASPQGGETGDVLTFTLTYKSFTGEGSVEDSARSVLKTMSGFIEDSLQIDEEAQTIQFQHRGRVAVPAVARLFGRNGFPKLSIKMSNR